MAGKKKGPSVHVILRKASPEARRWIERLRKLVRETVPDSEECVVPGWGIVQRSRTGSCSHRPRRAARASSSSSRNSSRRGCGKRRRAWA